MSASETNLRQTSDFLCQQKIVSEFTKKICKRVQVGKIVMSLGGTLRSFVTRESILPLICKYKHIYHPPFNLHPEKKNEGCL